MGYWDIFTQRFVDGASIRKGKAPPRRDHEARIQKMYSTEKYEAILRHQWIVHFLDCEIKAQMDADETVKGRNDGSTFRLAMAELQEFSSGDYSGSRRRATSAGAVDTTGRHGNRSSTENVFDPRSSERRRGSANPIFPRDADLGSARDQTQSQSYFVPSHLISLDILKHHQQRATFGKWKSIEQTNRDGKHGYLVRSDTPLDKDTVERLKDETKKVEAARKGTKAADFQRRSGRELSPDTSIRYAPPSTQNRHGGQTTGPQGRDESNSDDDSMNKVARDIRQLKTTESRRRDIDEVSGGSSITLVEPQRHGSRYDLEDERKPRGGNRQYHR